MAERAKAAPAGERLRRLLLVVPYAIAHPGTSIEELADMFGADPRELEQDIAVLGMTGLPPYGGGDNIDAWVDDGQVFVSMTQVLKRPLAMTRPEGLALYLRATEVLAALPEGEAAALRTARDKIALALGRATADDLRSSVEIAATPEPTAVPTVRAAIADHRAIEIRYYAASSGETTDRRIEPEAVFTANGQWYVVAWDRLREEERIFRADRILSVAPTDEGFTPRGLEGAGRPLYVGGEDDVEVRLLLHAGARWVADYYATSVWVERGEDLEIGFPAGRLEWVERLLLRLGGDASVVAPEALRERARTLAEATLAGYR